MACEIYLFLLDLGEFVDVLVPIDLVGPVVYDNRRDEKRYSVLRACWPGRAVDGAKPPICADWYACWHKLRYPPLNLNGLITPSV